MWRMASPSPNVGREMIERRGARRTAVVASSLERHAVAGTGRDLSPLSRD